MADVIVKETARKGRGVFAARRFEAGDIIEVCPVIALSPDDAARLDATHLYNYYFGWGADNKGAAIALGFGSLYNHSYSPNAAYNKHVADNTISIVALQQIAADDEILIKYNYGNAAENEPLWFEVK